MRGVREKRVQTGDKDKIKGIEGVSNRDGSAINEISEKQEKVKAQREETELLKGTGRASTSMR
jgi:hypothetical protein